MDSPGDNLLAEFTSVVDAVQCAVDIQRDIAERNLELPAERKMFFRIGINLGYVVEDGDRIYGDGFNIAARMESICESGGICISGSAFEHVEHKLDLVFEERLAAQILQTVIIPLCLKKLLTSLKSLLV